MHQLREYVGLWLIGNMRAYLIMLGHTQSDDVTYEDKFTLSEPLAQKLLRCDFRMVVEIIPSNFVYALHKANIICGIQIVSIVTQKACNEARTVQQDIMQHWEQFRSLPLQNSTGIKVWSILYLDQ